jgi:hypothetical protein
MQGYYYGLPHENDFVVAMGSATRGSLYLEGRYNYEDLRTGSVFAGWSVEAGEKFAVACIPMLGVAFGGTSGIIPALQLSLAYGLFDCYSESEYLIDLDDGEGSFLYTWLEIGVAPTDVLRLGLTAQRTRVAGSPLELERGLFAQVTPAFGSAGVYLFNLLSEHWFFVVGVEVAW